ncbi:MAG: hypothetical protein RLZZ112_73, partial [Verrucomicrobiota bacterium]
SRLGGIESWYNFALKRGLQETGAGEGTRTLDINLGKVALYQLSYARDWVKLSSPRRTESTLFPGLNPHPVSHPIRGGLVNSNPRPPGFLERLLHRPASQLRPIAVLADVPKK